MRKIYVLALANVHGNVDRPTPLAVSTSKEALRKWEQEQRAPAPYQTEPHQDAFGQNHGYSLVYKDEPLKWFNPGSDPADSFGGIFESTTSFMDDDSLRAEVERREQLWISSF